MFGSNIIDIAIGMVFIYLLLSLICSAANEIIERYSKKRAADLENGIKEMLKTPELVQKLYEHPLVNSLFLNQYTPGGKNLPSYIPSRNFALALMDLIGEGAARGSAGPGSTSPAEGAMAQLRTILDANQTLPPNVKKALSTICDASHTPAKMRENIENWFDSSMDRVSGFYKRRSQLIVLLLGLALSILLNVDSIALVRTLSTDRAMRDSLVAAATEYAKANPTPPTTNSSSSNSNSSAPGNTQAAGTESTKANSNNSAGLNSNSAAAKSGSSSNSAASGNSNSAAAMNQNSSSGSVGNSNQSSTNTNSSASSGTQPAPGTSPAPKSGCDTPECRVKENLKTIEGLGLPIGWNRRVSDPPDPRSIHTNPGRWVLRVLGWIITALALSLGAPFWFDLLNKFMVVRATVKPKEKSPEEQSKD